MLRRRQINADPGESRPRAALAVLARPFQALGWAFRERLLWRLEDLFRTVADSVKWSFQRLVWGVEQRVVWPARERIASWGYPHRIAGAGGLALVAIGAAALGVVLASGGEPAAEQVAAAPRVAAADDSLPASPKGPAEPALRGTPPVFGVANGEEVEEVEHTTADSAVSEPEAEDTAQASAESEPGEGESATGAVVSSKKPVPAGPAAMKVARRFANAFVFYEVGERPQRAQTIFGETATPRLAKALADRPPRLPANAKVPQAKVLNLVPGPRRGKAYTVSVSLLRVGVTSELRLQMKSQGGAWVITDVRG